MKRKLIAIVSLILLAVGGTLAIAEGWRILTAQVKFNVDESFEAAYWDKNASDWVSLPTNGNDGIQINLANVYPGSMDKLTLKLTNLGNGDLGATIVTADNINGTVIHNLDCNNSIVQFKNMDVNVPANSEVNITLTTEFDGAMPPQHEVGYGLSVDRGNPKVFENATICS